MEAFKTLMQGLELVILHLDPVIVMIVLASGFFSKRYVASKWINAHIPVAWKTLIVSAVFTAIYAYLLREEGSALSYLKMFLSYVVTTSFYELIIKQVLKRFSLQTNITKMEAQVFWDVNLTDEIIAIDGVGIDPITAEQLGDVDGRFSVVNDDTEVPVLIVQTAVAVTVKTAGNDIKTSTTCEWFGGLPIRPKS